MKKIKKILKWVLVLAALLYVGICVLFYFAQEKLLFDTSVKLSKNHVFKFSDKFEEKYISITDNVKLHGVLFKAEDPKGVILYLPGGRGMIDSIGVNANIYTKLNYDFFVLNYRGFGKSDGKIEGEKQLNEDIQTVYNELKKGYNQNSIVIWGYLLGSGPAAALAAKNNCQMLILQAPYYSMTELSKNAFPYLPIDLLQKYKFNNGEYLKEVKSPVTIIHGEKDKKIKVEVAYRLKEDLKPSDQLIILKKQGHNDFEKNEEFLHQIAQMLK